MGERRALEMVLTGRRVSGVEAARLGVCERVVDLNLDLDREEKKEGRDEGRRLIRARDLVLKEAVAMAKEICDGGPVTIGAAMRAVMMKGEMERGEEEEEEKKDELVEAREYERVLVTEDRTEALNAFAEKRKPVFRGR